LTPTEIHSPTSSGELEPNEMQLDDYVRFHERLGKRVVWLDGIPFSEYRRRFLWSLPRFRAYDVSSPQLRRLLGRRALGAIAMTTEPADRHAALCAASRADYGLDLLQKQTRNRTRRGLENCEIRRVGWDEMLARGIEINRQALKRQGRSSALGDPGWWRRQCQVSAEFPGVQAWGAYVGDDLTAYVNVIVHSAESSGRARPVANIMHFMSDNAHLKSYPNEALIFTVTNQLLLGCCDFVVLGSVSDDERLFAWKRHMGYRIKASPYHLVANPLLHLAKPFLPKLRVWMDGTMPAGDTGDQARPEPTSG
jgi:hypothetical protein